MISERRKSELLGWTFGAFMGAMLLLCLADAAIAFGVVPAFGPPGIGIGILAAIGAAGAIVAAVPVRHAPLEGTCTGRSPASRDERMAHERTAHVMRVAREWSEKQRRP